MAGKGAAARLLALEDACKAADAEALITVAGTLKKGHVSERILSFREAQGTKPACDEIQDDSQSVLNMIAKTIMEQSAASSAPPQKRAVTPEEHIPTPALAQQPLKKPRVADKEAALDVNNVQALKEEDVTTLELAASVRDNEGDFSLLVARALQLRTEGKSEMSLYWGALDLRDRGNELLRDDNVRGHELLDPAVLNSVREHAKQLLGQANGRLSQSVVDLLVVVRSLINSPENLSWLSLDKVATVLEISGMKGFLVLLEDKLTDLHSVLEEEEGPDEETEGTDYDSDGRCLVQDLLEVIRRIDPADKEVRWVGRKISQWAEKLNNEPKDTTERTVDLFNLASLAKLPSPIKLRYGDGSSKADKSDKQQRQSSSRTGKKVDFLFLVDDLELGVGENSGGIDAQHMSENFIDNIKGILMESAATVAKVEALMTAAIEDARRQASAVRRIATSRTRGRGIALPKLSSRRNSWSRTDNLPMPSGTPKKKKK
ncbi:hypothetical protein HK104_001608 [Borealophlyctis nickersoniae]|nr:hypothetical protein HK104_001608 [Borealophlyctis nickersoniae]